jgi:hypothetical protein
MRQEEGTCDSDAPNDEGHAPTFDLLQLGQGNRLEIHGLSPSSRKWQPHLRPDHPALRGALFASFVASRLDRIDTVAVERDVDSPVPAESLA